MKTTNKLVLVALLMLVLSSVACTFSGFYNPLENTKRDQVYTAGFFDGVVHGALSPIVFFVGLFNNDVRIFETHNNGNWYYLGWMMGAGLLFNGASSSSKKRRRESDS